MWKSLSDFHKPELDSNLDYTEEDKRRIIKETEEYFLQELWEWLILDENIAKWEWRGEDWFLEIYDLWKNASLKTFSDWVEQKESVNLKSLYEISKEEVRKLEIQFKK